jgi:hypothetical protein
MSESLDTLITKGELYQGQTVILKRRGGVL